MKVFLLLFVVHVVFSAVLCCFVECFGRYTLFLVDLVFSDLFDVVAVREKLFLLFWTILRRFFQWMVLSIVHVGLY